MIRVLGGPKRLCDGLTRRDLLQVGSLGLLGLGGEAGRGAIGSGGSGRAGGAGRVRPGEVVHPAVPLRVAQPARDVRPQARRPGGDPRRARVRSPSSVPGLNVCERLPELAQVMDKVTVIRSVSHPYPIHGVAYATTGHPADRRPDGAEPARPGALAVHRLGGRLRRRRAASRAAPRCPATWCSPGPSAASASARSPAPARTAGSSARRTTRSYAEFVGQGTRTARKTLARADLGRPGALSRHHPREPVPARVGRSASAPS